MLPTSLYTSSYSWGCRPLGPVRYSNMQEDLESIHTSTTSFLLPSLQHLGDARGQVAVASNGLLGHASADLRQGDFPHMPIDPNVWGIWPRIRDGFHFCSGKGSDDAHRWQAWQRAVTENPNDTWGIIPWLAWYFSVPVGAKRRLSRWNGPRVPSTSRFSIWELSTDVPSALQPQLSVCDTARRRWSYRHGRSLIDVCEERFARHEMARASSLWVGFVW